MTSRIQNWKAPRLLPLAMPGAMGATLLLCVAAILFGLVPLFARHLQAAGIDSATIAFSRFLMSCLILLPFLPVNKTKIRSGLVFVFAGLLLGVGWTAWLESLKHASVAAVSVVYMSYPLFTVLMTWIVRGQRPAGRSFLACSLILGATITVLSPTSSDVNLPALLSGLPAPIVFGLVITMVSSNRNGLSPLERMGSMMLGASLYLGPMSFESGDLSQFPGWTVLFLLIGIGVFTSFVPQVIFSYCAPIVGPARTASAGSFELIVMFMIGFLAFGEQLGQAELMAGAMVLASVFLAPSDGPVHAALRLYRRDPRPVRESKIDVLWQSYDLHPEQLMHQHKVPARFFVGR